MNFLWSIDSGRLHRHKQLDRQLREEQTERGADSAQDQAFRGS